MFKMSCAFTLQPNSIIHSYCLLVGSCKVGLLLIKKAPWWFYGQRNWRNSFA